MTSMERVSRYWVTAQGGKTDDEGFEVGVQTPWPWAGSAAFIRWLSDGERRYAQQWWRLARVWLKRHEASNSLALWR